MRPDNMPRPFAPEHSNGPSRVEILKEILNEYPTPNFHLERAALTAAIKALEANEDALAAAQANGAIGYVHNNGGQFYIEWFGRNQLPNFAEQFLYTHPHKEINHDNRTTGA